MSRTASSPAAPPRRGGLLTWTLLGLLAITWLDLRRCHARRRVERTPAKPETLQTWEGEGGGIPSLRGERTPGQTATPAQRWPLAD
jgi:hypothetical protein